MIIDRVHVLVQAGNGGNGCESIYTRPDRKRLPTGGDGGNGGDLILRASHDAPQISSLRFKQHILAPSGEHGKSSKKRGKDGEDLVILVPCSSRVYDRKRGLLIRELINEGDEVIIAEGGRGGSGNFGGKTASRGEPGQVLEVEITIRLQADAFFVGLPNSGKSTLLNKLTRAHAKQGDYPFATRNAEMGVWSYNDYEQVTFCELPSVYAASHEGRGVGMDFLKHLESAKLIVWVLDPTSQFSQSLEEGLNILKGQVERSSKELLLKPQIVIVNKTDLEASKEAFTQENFNPDLKVFKISAVTGEGLDEFKKYIAETMESFKTSVEDKSTEG